MFLEHEGVSACDRCVSDEKNKWTVGHICGVRDGYECDGHDTWGLKKYPLAMVYAPLQAFENIYDTEKALEAGTLFEELDLPFEGESVYNSGKGGCCRG